MSVDLILRWHDLARDSGLRDPADAIGEELIARYREPHRRFHVPAHLTQMLELLDEQHADVRLRLAAWFHDAVYQPGRADNERRSAALARHHLSFAALPEPDIDFVVRAVIATDGHSDADPAFDPLLDADLAVLGADADDYQRYRKDIRQEFAKIPSLLFRPARARFLRNMLERPTIYQTAECRLRFEAQARRNLQEELRLLSEGR